jgi:uncharacterized flavoprotein (TIGR03862 family)
MVQHVEIAIIGGGPAGLMVADRLSAAGLSVHLYERMPTVGRKFLQAGKGGLNLTHAEAESAFIRRFGQQADRLYPYLQRFSAQSMRDWAASLGVETFVGSSGRVFPQDMKAAPLLRAWVHRLKQQGVIFHLRHRWLGWQDGLLCFEHQQECQLVQAKQVIFALGGASWPHLGSDGRWTELFRAQGIAVTTLLPANCAFQVDWPDWLIERYAGTPVKQVEIHFQTQARIGEWVMSQQGIEGSLVYALSADIRDHLLTHPSAQILLNLLPYQSIAQTQQRLSIARGKRSWSQHLKKCLGIDGVRYALLKALAPPDVWQNRQRLAEHIHRLPLALTGIGSLEEAISTAGGVDWSALDAQLMLQAMPDHYCVGEMLDWEAPTGGYLLTMSMATAVVVAEHILNKTEPTTHVSD